MKIEEKIKKEKVELKCISDRIGVLSEEVDKNRDDISKLIEILDELPILIKASQKKADKIVKLETRKFFKRCY